MAFKNPKTIEKYFEWREQDPDSGTNYWRCRTCGDDGMQTGDLSRHLFCNHHKEIFLELERKEAFKKIKPRGRRASTKEPTDIKDVYVQCEYCKQEYTNNVLSAHRGRQSYIGKKFGCPDRDAFYENGMCRELQEAVEHRLEPTKAEIEKAKQKADETNREAETRARKLIAEAKSDKEKEEANEFAKATENNKQMAAVYVRVNVPWLDLPEPDFNTALKNWPYTGLAKDLTRRQQSHNRTLAAAEQHFAVRRKEASFDQNEKAIKVIKGVPMLLARCIEHELIIARDWNPAIKNEDVPYQRKINEMDSQQIRALATKLLVKAFRKRKVIKLTADDSLPETPTTTSKSIRPTRRNRKRHSDDLNVAVQSPNEAAVATPSSSKAKISFFPEVEELSKKYKEVQEALQQLTPKKKWLFEHTKIKRRNSLS